MPEHIARPDYAETGIPVSERQAKSSHSIISLNDEEIEGMQIAGKVIITDSVTFTYHLFLVWTWSVRCGYWSRQSWCYNWRNRSARSWGLHWTRVLPIPSQLLQFPQILLHVSTALSSITFYDLARSMKLSVMVSLTRDRCRTAIYSTVSVSCLFFFHGDPFSHYIWPAWSFTIVWCWRCPFSCRWGP